MASTLPALIERFAVLAPSYDVALCDVWGVVHNSIVSFPEACDALRRFRVVGGTVIMITNAPRPGDEVIRFISRLGVPADAYDGIVSSGDVTRAYVSSHLDQTVFRMGPERDTPIYEGLDVRFAPVETADYVVCSGLFDDETETAEDYRALLGQMRARKLFMVCANPDVVVERGEKLVYCAGAIADLYQHLGGEVLYAGKPHRPLYDQALAQAETLRGRATPLERVLAIGDSVRTDLAGAVGLGVDCLFITSGIHAEEFGGREDPDLAVARRAFAAAGVMPTAIMHRLRW
ncbi:MAG: TIGR01459 family HAD-type hydrolase [Rhizobiales bacterium]|nr:TIGR01459 family HAD-type hydrolase [Hyphomicrobiales bacterium]